MGLELLRVRVTARSDRNEVRCEGQSVKVWVTATPADGQANEAVVRLLAKRLDISPSRVQVVKGHRSREKSISLEGMTVSAAILLLCG